MISDAIEKQFESELGKTVELAPHPYENIGVVFVVPQVIVNL